MTRRIRFNPDIHHRQSIRLKHHDYSSPGAYFVTICVHEKQILLGDVQESQVVPNHAGNVVLEVLQSLPQRFPDVVIDIFVIMPNHVHVIIEIAEPQPVTVGAQFIAPLPASEDGVHGATHEGAIYRAPTLGEVVRAFKAVSAMRIRREIGLTHFAWQRNYFERVIRSDRELDDTRAYILENPLCWHLDEENPNR